MPHTKDTDRSLSDVQLDDFDVNRQRERLEESRPGNLQSDKQAPPGQAGEPSRQGERR